MDSRLLSITLITTLIYLFSFEPGKEDLVEYMALLSIEKCDIIIVINNG